MACEPVWILGDRSPLHEINVSANNSRKLLPHRRQVSETPAGGLFEGHEDVDIAFGAEIVAQDGAKDREFGNLPLLAEGAQAALGDLQLPDFHAGSIPEVDGDPHGLCGRGGFPGFPAANQDDACQESKPDDDEEERCECRVIDVLDNAGE